MKSYLIEFCSIRNCSIIQKRLIDSMNKIICIPSDKRNHKIDLFIDFEIYI